MTRVGDSKKLLAGPPASAITRLAGLLALLIVPMIAITAVPVFVLGDAFGDSAVFGLALVAILLLLAATGVVHTAAKIKEAREFYAGYTTVMRAHVGVDQIDPESGRVVRVAGEPFLTRDQYDSRLALVRQLGSEA